jgi:hypothetical protein
MDGQNDDLETGSGANDNAGKKDSVKSNGKKDDSKSNAGKSNKQSKQKADPADDTDDDQIDPLDEKKFSQRDLNRHLAKQKKKADDEKDLTELERVKKEADELRSQLNLTTQKSKFQTAIGLPETAANRLFNAYRDDIEFDDKGNIENLADIKKMAKSEFPTLFEAIAPKSKADGGEGKEKSDAGGSMNDVIRRKAGRG